MKGKISLLAGIVFMGMTYMLPAEAGAQSVPQWVSEDLDILVADGVLTGPPEGTFTAQDTLSREEAAFATAKALVKIRQNESLSDINGRENKAETKSVSVILAELEEELAPELKVLDYKETEQLLQKSRQGKKPSLDTNPKRLKINGELRSSYVLNRGNDAENFNDSRLRLRLYADYDIDGNWHGITMAESDKSFFGRGDNTGRTRLERGYVDGFSGSTRLTAGRFGYNMGDGNIYDSEFSGVKVQFAGPVQYTVASGSADEFSRSAILTAHYKSYDYSLDAGIHHFSRSDDREDTITTLSGKYDFESFSLGAMYLYSSEGGADGYVLSASQGELETWKPGTHTAWIKYYYQPQGTYIQHTMTGLADAVSGFKGLGCGLGFGVRENLVANMEYYHLRDMTNDQPNHTLWFDLTYYFSAGK